MKPVKLGTASLKALGILVALGAVARAGMPYLPLIGPPPVRVQAVHKSTATVVHFMPEVAARGTNQAAAGSAETNQISSANPINGSVLAGNALDMLPAPQMIALPPPDLIAITPQMLANYFGPGSNGTNAAPAGPFKLSFLPPLPADHSSHAEYEVK
jgi:hypothetical protein